MEKIILIALLLTPAAFADNVGLTVTDAISEAEQNSPSLKQLNAHVEKVSWEKLDAWSAYLPHISANYNHYFKSSYMKENVVFGGSALEFAAAYPQDNLNLEAEITVFDGFAGYRRIRAAGAETEAAQLDFERAKFQLNQSVRIAFFQALAAQKLFEVAQVNVKTLEEHLLRTKLSERTGYGSRFDVLRIEATLEEARAEQEAADNNVYISRSALTEILGMTTVDTRPLIGDLPILKETDVPKDLAFQVEDRSDLQAQFKRDEAAHHESWAARGAYMPSISVFANEQFYKFGNFSPSVLPNDDYQQAWAVGLRLKWNLFDGGHTWANERQATAAAIEAQAETQKKMAHLPRELDTWKRKFYYSVSLYKARLRSLAQHEESVRLAGVAVKSGARTHTEMLDAELDLFRSRGGLVRAQADAIEALGQLELAVGHKLSEVK